MGHLGDSTTTRRHEPHVVPLPRGGPSRRPVPFALSCPPAGGEHGGAGFGPGRGGGGWD